MEAGGGACSVSVFPRAMHSSSCTFSQGLATCDPSIDTPKTVSGDVRQAEASWLHVTRSYERYDGSGGHPDCGCPVPGAAAPTAANNQGSTPGTVAPAPQEPPRREPTSYPTGGSQHAVHRAISGNG